MDNLPKQTSYSFTLTAEQQDLLAALLYIGNYKQVDVPYTRIAVKGDKLSVNLYESGKCLVQGANAESFVLFVLEPNVLQTAGLGYEKEVNPEEYTPHIGSDESGKGDFFGPLVVSAVFINEKIAEELKKCGIRDCKTLSDKQVVFMAQKAKTILTPRNYKQVIIPPATYNKLYTKIGNVNKLLAWGHARVIENLLESVPDCPRAVIDQFGRTESVINRALLPRARGIKIEQMHKAESDIAVAAASVLARDTFLNYIGKYKESSGLEIPKGAGDIVKTRAIELVKKLGPKALLEYSKCHFKTTDEVLSACNSSRSTLGEFGALTSRAARMPEEKK